MNFSAGKASRKWPCSGLACGEWPMVIVAAALLTLCSPAAPAEAARQSGQAPWGDLFGEAGRSRAGPQLPRTGAVAEAASGRCTSDRVRKARGWRTDACRGGQGSRTGRPSAAAALGLPVGADGRDRHRPQHSRHPWRWRLRRRGSGPAGGRGAAGQAPGFGEARRDPPLRHGVGDCGLDPHRHGAAWRQASAASSATSTISTRSNAAAATAWLAPDCRNTVAPMRSMFAR